MVAAALALMGIGPLIGIGVLTGVAAVAGSLGFVAEAGRVACCWACAEMNAQASASRAREARPAN
jgi:hypothetical protein